MSYGAVAVAFKSKGGKGSRGVSFFPRFGGEATVHLVEDGERLCGISKPAKKTWTLDSRQAMAERVRVGAWTLHPCKNCQTHL